jgi:hypothetical protein
MPFGLARIFIIPGMSRKRFSFLATLLIAGEMFLLIMLYGQSYTLAIGTILFLLMLPGGYMAMFLFYPVLEKATNRWKDLK